MRSAIEGAIPHSDLLIMGVAALLLATTAAALLVTRSKISHARRDEEAARGAARCADDPHADLLDLVRSLISGPNTPGSTRTPGPVEDREPVSGNSPR